MQLKPLFVAAALAAVGLSSQAATVNWGAHDQLESALGFSAGAPIQDAYLFTLGAKSIVSSSLTSFGAAGTFRLFSYGADGVKGTTDDVSFGSWAFNGAPVVHTVPLAAGNYYYDVTGTVGATGGAYSINSSAVAVPVPEPETYAMLAAGLGIVGFVASRRRRD